MSLSTAPAEAESDPLMNVLVMFGLHPIIDWVGPASQAEQFAAAQERRFRSLRVESRPVPSVTRAGA